MKISNQVWIVKNSFKIAVIRIYFVLIQLILYYILLRENTLMFNQDYFKKLLLSLRKKEQPIIVRINLVNSQHL